MSRRTQDEGKKAMLREHCEIGMKVVFGRPNGEKTVGEIVEIHETTAKIKALESRGDGGGTATEGPRSTAPKNSPPDRSGTPPSTTWNL